MRPTRYATSRQKSCQQCSTAKAGCDRKAGGCARCAQRSLNCSYPPALSSGISARISSASNDAEPYSPYSPPTSNDLFPTSSRESGQALDRSTPGINHPKAVTNAHFPCRRPPDGTAFESRDAAVLDFSSLELVCPINVDEISNRWLNAYIANPSQVVKEYPTNITSFIYRILKSYAAVTIHGRGVPPFVHSSQLMALATSPPLSACLSLIRICENPLPGSEGVVTDVLQREMNNIYEQRSTYDDIALLGAFQAYLIYTMVLFFQLSQGSNPFLRQAMMNLQDIACVSSCQGLMCVAEQQRVRPRWEAWTVAEAKRRTIFTMYLFDSVLSTQDGLPTFFGTELQGLPAPANKAMWEAQARHDWEKIYNVYLVKWMDGDLCIDELWPIPADLDEPGLTQRRSRVDGWLQNIDEFGTMLYAVTSCTHGG